MILTVKITVESAFTADWESVYQSDLKEWGMTMKSCVEEPFLFLQTQKKISSSLIVISPQ